MGGEGLEYRVGIAEVRRRWIGLKVGQLLVSCQIGAAFERFNGRAVTSEMESPF